MARFRKKSVVIEAEQFTGANFQQIETFTRGDSTVSQAGEMTIATLEGTFHVSTGDWIIKGVQGEFYPIKDAIFRETYEPVREESAAALADAPRCESDGS